MSKKKRATSDAVELLDEMVGDDPELEVLVADARASAEVAQLIYDARSEADLTQQQLADLVGTTQSVIARLEDSDYDGHSLSMLQRIADALDRELEIHMKPKPQAA